MKKLISVLLCVALLITGSVLADERTAIDMDRIAITSAATPTRLSAGKLFRSTADITQTGKVNKAMSEICREVWIGAENAPVRFTLTRNVTPTTVTGFLLNEMTSTGGGNRWLILRNRLNIRDFWCVAAASDTISPTIQIMYFYYKDRS